MFALFALDGFPNHFSFKLKLFLMQTRHSLFLPLLLALIGLTNQGCDPCQSPEETQKLADLIVKTFNLNKNDIPVNEIVSCGTLISNLFGGDDCAEAEGYDAEDFYVDYELFYRQSASSGWTSLGGLSAGDRPFIERLISNGEQQTPYTEMRFTQPGEYYLLAKADITNAVTEREEGNNNRTSGSAVARSTDVVDESGIIRVYLTPDTDMKLLEENIKNKVFFQVVK